MSADPSERIVREKDFHNQWALSLDVDSLLVREAFESPAAVENKYALEQLGDLKGKKVLDLGCGAGETSVYLALRGAQVQACDIAEEFLKVGRRLAEKYGVQVDFSVADTARLPYPDASFDCVFGNGILHHVELEPTAGEIRRVLKKGGTAVFIEPLPYNPVINIYRHMAKGVRTEDEKPLGFKELNKLKPFFSAFSHKEFWLFSLSVFFHFYFVRRWDPSKVRYWKKVIEEGPAYQNSLLKLFRFDESLLSALPFLRPLCWNTVIVGKK